MDFWSESSDEEDPDPPRYSDILREEEYEDEAGPQGWENSKFENNFESHQVEVIPWDPREPSFFFPIN